MEIAERCSRSKKKKGCHRIPIQLLREQGNVQDVGLYPLHSVLKQFPFKEEQEEEKKNPFTKKTPSDFSTGGVARGVKRLMEHSTTKKKPETLFFTEGRKNSFAYIRCGSFSWENGTSFDCLPDGNYTRGKKSINGLSPPPSTPHVTINHLKNFFSSYQAPLRLVDEQPNWSSLITREIIDRIVERRDRLLPDFDGYCCNNNNNPLWRTLGASFSSHNVRVFVVVV